MANSTGISSSAQELVTIVRTDGTISYQGPTVNEMLGYPHGNLKDEDFLSFVHPDDYDRMKSIFDELFADSETRVQRVEYRFRRRSQSWAWIDSIATLRQKKIVLISRNVTQRKEKEQQAAVLHRILRHNLRNELNVILYQAQKLADSEYPREVRQSAGEIVESTSSLDRLAENARVIGEFFDSTQRHQESQNLSQIILELIKEFSSQYPSVEFDVAFPDAQHVLASPNLDIAVRHVLENAIQHNDAENPKVRIRMLSQMADSDELKIAISDNGPGMPEQEQAVLVGGKETPLQHSSGIGLWIVNWIISHSGGQIKFERGQLGGSRVVLSLPVPSPTEE